MSDRVCVDVRATDPVSLAGLRGQLRYRPEVELLAESGSGDGHVVVLVGDEIDDSLLQQVRAARRVEGARVVLVVGSVNDNGVLAAIEAGVSGLLRRVEATPERLVSAIEAAAAGEGTVPSDLLGRLMRQVGSLQRHQLHPRGLHFNGLTHREISILRLIADGHSTTEIARQLAYSERTIKNTLQGVTTRLQLRNRSHAVAYALREGMLS